MGLAVGLLSACESAMDRRISAHQETWRELSEQDQQRLLRGQVHPGDTEEMVRLALGPPDKVLAITTQDGRKQTVWWYDLIESSGDFFLRVPTSPPRMTSREKSFIFLDGIVLNQAGIAVESMRELADYRARYTAENLTARLDSLVALTPEQNAKALDVFEQANRKLYAFSRDERPAKGRPIRVKMRADIRAMLTPDQQAKYDAAPQYLAGGSTKSQ
jgi:hypothetical protein